MGTIKDVLIKIDKISFLVDFIVIDVEVNPKIPLILEWTFMTTAILLVDTDKGKVKDRIRDCDVCFKVIGIT